MATQWLSVAALAGDAGAAVRAMFRGWRDGQAPPGAVDGFCERLRANAGSLSVVYFCEWLDRWLMGDAAPGPGAVEGRRYQASCLSPAEAVAWAAGLGGQFVEQEWLAARLREAAACPVPDAGPSAVVVVREPLGPSATDDEVRAALRGMPAWLSAV